MKGKPLDIEQVKEIEPGQELVCINVNFPLRDAAPPLLEGEAYILREVQLLVETDGEREEGDQVLRHYGGGLGGDRTLISVPEEMVDVTLGELVNYAYFVVDCPTAGNGKGKAIESSVYDFRMFSLLE